MTASWLLVVLFSLVTGNPFAAVLLALAVLWTSDRVTVGLFPDPARAVGRWRRALRLRSTLAANPSDRRARLELAELLLARRPAEAAELARRNAEAGDEDVHTAFLLGAALARSGEHERAEGALAFARDLDPGFRMGEIDLELGRSRLARGDAAGAREALERLLAARPGTIEGRLLLSRALTALGEGAAAARVRDEAWVEFRALPRFRRRQDRRFAWRMRPWRGVAAFAAVVAGVAVGALVVAGVAIAGLPADDGGGCGARGGIERAMLRPAGPGVVLEQLTVGREGVPVRYVRRGDRVAYLIVSVAPTAPASEAEREERLRVLGTRRDAGRAWAHLDDGRRAAVFPIEMRVSDLEALRRGGIETFDDVLAYVRRFEAPGG